MGEESAWLDYTSTYDACRSAKSLLPYADVQKTLSDIGL
jgi:hypothetical protein